MDKPLSMSVKDYLMRVFSVRYNIPLKTVEAVVDFQFEEAHKALKSNHIVEISGFGKFIFNHKKAQKALDRQYKKIEDITEKLKDISLEEVKIKKLQESLGYSSQYIDLLKSKLNGLKTGTADLRGVEEQTNPSRGIEGSDTGSITGKEKNM